MPTQRQTLGAVTLAVLIAASGCIGTIGGGSGSGSDAPPGLDAAEIREDATAAMTEVETAEYELSATVDTERGTVEMDATGAVDRADREQRIDLEMTVDNGQTSQSIDTTAYVVGDTMYTKVYGQWQQQSAEDVWQSGTQIEQQTAVLEAVDVSFDRNATVQGVDTYVLSVEADDTDALRSALADQLQQQGDQQGLDLLENSDIKSFEAEMFVSQDTDIVRKMTMTFTLDNDRYGKIDIDMTVVYTDVGGEVDVTVPDAATGSVDRVPATAVAHAGR